MNEEIRAEIQAAAKKHGYRPHANARSLRTGQTHAIGVLLFNVRTAKWVVGPVFFEYLAGITDRLVEQEYKTIVVRDWQLAGDEGNRTPILFRERAMDGLICTHPTTPLLAQFIDKLNVPVIWLDSGHHEERGTVSRDEACATRLAVETLAGLGHRKIVYLDKPGSGPSKPADKAYVVHHSVTERRAAYQAVMGERNLDPKCMVASAYEETIGPLKEMLAQSDRPTACICYSTNEAFWLLSACGAMGLSVPKDLSIIALDDNASIADSWPELGRISFDRYAMGRCAAEMMLERLENKTVVPPSLNFAKHQILGSTFAHPSS